MHLTPINRPKSQKFSFVFTMDPTKHTVKKLNIWGETAVEKSPWIKA